MWRGFTSATELPISPTSTTSLTFRQLHSKLILYWTGSWEISPIRLPLLKNGGVKYNRSFNTITTLEILTLYRWPNIGDYCDKLSSNHIIIHKCQTTVLVNVVTWQILGSSFTHQGPAKSVDKIQDSTIKHETRTINPISLQHSKPTKEAHVKNRCLAFNYNKYFNQSYNKICNLHLFC